MPMKRPDPPLELPEPPSPASPAFKAHLAKFAASPSTRSRTRSLGSISPRTLPPAPPSPPLTAQRSPSATPVRKQIPCRPRSTRARESPHFTVNKEDQDDDDDDDGDPSRDAKKEKKKQKKKPSRGYADPSTYSELGQNPLVDYVKLDLDLLLCGINPGVKSAQLGQHYASPTNHFWKSLAGSGLTDRLLHPSEGSTLPEVYGIGSTNLVPRPSAEMSELPNEEMKACVPALLRKLVTYKPKMVAFVGMRICEVVFRHLHSLPQTLNSIQFDGPSPSKKKKQQQRRKPAMPKIKLGLQPVTISLPPDTGETIKGGGGGGGGEEEKRRKIWFWCLPSTSARVVAYQLVDKIRIFGELKTDVELLKKDSLDPLPIVVDYRSEDLFLPASSTVSLEGTTVKVEKEEDEQLEELAEEEAKPWTLTLIESPAFELKGEQGTIGVEEQDSKHGRSLEPGEKHLG